jgi:acyl-CoA thioesterase FadM
VRWARFLLVAIGSLWRPKLRPDEQSVLDLRVWLTDVDLSVANNAAYFVYFELGRLDLQLRNGFAKMAAKNGWFAPMRSMVVEYWKPLKRFQKFRLVTKVLSWDDDWIYFDHRIERNGVCIASAFCKSMVLGRSGRIAPTAVALETWFQKSCAASADLRWEV